MRPQFHHIDAQAQITKTSLSRASGKPPPKGQQPITTAAITAQRNKGPDDANSTGSTYDATTKFLENAADENWKRLWYRDEDEPEAYALFDETMRLNEQQMKEAKELRSEWGTDKYLDAIKLGTGVEEAKKQPVKKIVKKRIPKKVDATAGSSRR